MKRLIPTLLLLMVVTTLSAVPVRPGIWKTVKLANGKEIRVELRGDEYMSYWQAETGETFVKKDGADYYVPADMDALVQQAIEQRMQNPLPSPEARKAPRRITLGSDHPAYVGEKKSLIILAEFTDQKFEEGHDAEYYRRVANELNFTHEDGFVGSIRDYFRSQSYGQFDLTFDVAGPIQLAHEMAYYGAPTSGGAHDCNVAAMVRDAVSKAVLEYPDFTPYDWFGDGNVDQVFIIYAGQGQADGGHENTIWPHRSSISALRIGNKRVSVYACANEIQGNGTVNGIGTFCHEFSHCLGLPDLYDTKYGAYNNNVRNYGMASWDLMSNGNYLGNTYRPCSYSGYERNYCGWKEPVVLTNDTVVKDVKGIDEGGDYFIIYNDAYKDEYYILENRNQKGWDAAQYGSGLLITHIDYDKTLWSWNIVNSHYDSPYNDHPRFTPIPADNSTSTAYADAGADVFPQGKKNRLADYTLPASTLYNANTDGKFYMSKPVTNITKNDDGTVSFEFANEVGKVEVLPEGVYFKETFKRTDGVGGNEEVWNPALMDIVFLVPDNLEWTFNVGTGADECAIVGSNTRAGNATSPEFTIEGPSVVTFKTAAYGSEGSTTLTLGVTGGDATLAETKFSTPKLSWQECSASLTAPSYPATCQLTFKNNKKRFFLDEIFVTSVESSGIEAITTIAPARKQDASIYTLDGRNMGTDASSLRPGLYIRNGRKIVISD